MSGDDHVLNQPFTTRSRKSGRQYTTIVVESEPLVHDLDPKRLGAPVAAAIAEHLRQRILGITVRAAESTLARRDRARRENPQGPSYMRRYAGGRIGATPPQQSDRLFNDSGRLAASIVARAATGANNVGQWVINCAANRLDESTFGRGFQAMLQRLAQYVPEITDQRRLMDSLPIQKAIREGMRGMIQKQSKRIEELKEARARAVIGLARQLFAA